MSFFKPEDFEHFVGADDLTKHCNRILEERGVRVYGSETNDNPKLLDFFRPDISEEDTHQALLVAIEELPKKECEHEPDYDQDVATGFTCKHCGVKLRAKWEVAE